MSGDLSQRHWMLFLLASGDHSVQIGAMYYYIYHIFYHISLHHISLYICWISVLKVFFYEVPLLFCGSVSCSRARTPKP